MKQQDLIDLCIQSISGLRELHPRMGGEKMYYILRPEGIGRDKFIKIYMQSGFGLVKLRNFSRTTFSTRSHCYNNLLCGIKLTDVNQLWASDITYIEVSGIFYYIIMLIDVYSRRIIGWNIADSLEAKHTLTCLKRALKTRAIKKYNNLIHHSDRGVQYASIKYTDLLELFDISISMCTSAYENAHIERVNGIIKNEYLIPKSTKSFSQCKRELKNAVKMYNQYRPHRSIGMITPMQYEINLKSISLSQRTKIPIYTETK